MLDTRNFNDMLSAEDKRGGTPLKENSVILSSGIQKFSLV
jgi:hypothetical protein